MGDHSKSRPVGGPSGACKDKACVVGIRTSCSLRQGNLCAKKGHIPLSATVRI